MENILKTGNELKTGYDWCFECSIRIVNLEDWETSLSSKDESYYKEKISLVEFYKRLDACVVKSKSMPRKTEMFLEYRMYGLVPYNISPIQQGIQFGHAVVDYARMVEEFDKYNAIYKKFADEDKTFIILNGGTTNNSVERPGTIQEIHNIIEDYNEECESDETIDISLFYEPDLNDAMTAICFIGSEKSWNIDDYMSFKDYLLGFTPVNIIDIKGLSYQKLKEKFLVGHIAWTEEIMGGKRNVLIREIITGKKRA